VVALLSGETTIIEMGDGLPILLVLLFVVASIALVASMVLTDDLRQAHMRVAKGKAKLLPGQYRGTPYYRVRVGRKTFNLMNERQFNAFREGETYQVYYVRYWPDIILSVDRTDESRR
jgi:hypothetical protein